MTIHRAKQEILSLYYGWMTRKVVNCLAKEIQDYVNMDDVYQKERLKRHFLVLFDNVIKNKLWLQKYGYRLQRLQNLESHCSRN
jgi:hypothetical protein